jgi:biopolymer transport protein ExbD
MKVVRMNDQFDYVKVGIDKDGDLFVRTDLMLRNLDGQELKQQLQQVANAADEAYGQIKPMLRGR